MALALPNLEGSDSLKSPLYKGFSKVLRHRRDQVPSEILGLRFLSALMTNQYSSTLCVRNGLCYREDPQPKGDYIGLDSTFFFLFYA